MKKMIIYSLKEKSNAERCKIIQDLFGYIDKSNKSQYIYKRKGKLDGINFKKDRNNILYFTSEKDIKKVVKLFRNAKIKFFLAESKD
jgi:hypothetical protein